MAPRLGWGCQLDFQLLPTAREGPTQPPHRLVACSRALQAMAPRLLLAVQPLLRVRRRHVVHVRPVRIEESVRKALPAGEGRRGWGICRTTRDPSTPRSDTDRNPKGTRRRAWLADAATHRPPWRHIPGRACQGGRERNYEADASAAAGVSRVPSKILL